MAAVWQPDPPCLAPDHGPPAGHGAGHTRRPGCFTWDDLAHAELLGGRGTGYLDCGVSGGARCFTWNMW
jgi:hypothetical protein